jgi:Zn-dependent membrane protease YugP
MLGLFDPLYLLLVSPAILLSLFATFKVKSTFAHFSRVRTRRGLSGAETARAILLANGIRDVKVEEVHGFLSDHYDPTHKVLRLSPDVYRGDSLSSVGVAAHEVGHALQHADGYGPLRLRSALVPVTSIGSNLAFPLILMGFFFQAMGLAYAGVILFGAIVLFQLVTLPVEFNASTRAIAQLSNLGIFSSREEEEGSRKVLSAAALTYVAAAVAAILNLVYWLMRLGILGGRREE